MNEHGIGINAESAQNFAQEKGLVLAVAITLLKHLFGAMRFVRVQTVLKTKVANIILYKSHRADDRRIKIGVFNEGGHLCQELFSLGKIGCIKRQRPFDHTLPRFKISYKNMRIGIIPNRRVGIIKQGGNFFAFPSVNCRRRRPLDVRLRRALPRFDEQFFVLRRKQTIGKLFNRCRVLQIDAVREMSRECRIVSDNRKSVIDDIADSNIRQIHNSGQAAIIQMPIQIGFPLYDLNGCRIHFADNRAVAHNVYVVQQ